MDMKNKNCKTQITSLKLIKIIKLLINKGYTLKDFDSQDFYCDSYFVDFIDDYENNALQKENLQDFVNTLVNIDNMERLAVNSVSFKNKNTKSRVVIRNNGIISIDKIHYTEIINDIAKALNKSKALD